MRSFALYVWVMLWERKMLEFLHILLKDHLGNLCSFHNPLNIIFFEMNIFWLQLLTSAQGPMFQNISCQNCFSFRSFKILLREKKGIYIFWSTGGNPKESKKTLSQCATSSSNMWHHLKSGRGWCWNRKFEKNQEQRGKKKMVHFQGLLFFPFDEFGSTYWH